MSNHPLTLINEANYTKAVAPKPVYDYMRDVRGWDHKVGINAKAQNSPSTGVAIEQSAEALNCIMGFGGVFVALFGNSPFEQGRITGSQESRLTMWRDMFKNAAFPSDYRLSQLPERPFGGLADYFMWMYGDGTNMYFVVTGDDGTPPKNEKGNVRFTRVKGDPSMLEFMAGNEWSGIDTHSGEVVPVVPDLGHFAMNQFTQFSAARIRYGLKSSVSVEPKQLVAAVAAGNAATEALFRDVCDYAYIEGRDPGANFPDAFLRSIDSKMAETMVMAPSALQAGIIANLDRATNFRQSVGWEALNGLRDAAIKDGMQASYKGRNIRDVAMQVIELAREGLSKDEEALLAYPHYVVSTGMNGAGRALHQFEQLKGNDLDKIKVITRERAIVL